MSSIYVESQNGASKSLVSSSETITNKETYSKSSITNLDSQNRSEDQKFNRNKQECQRDTYKEENKLENQENDKESVAYDYECSKECNSSNLELSENYSSYESDSQTSRSQSSFAKESYGPNSDIINKDYNKSSLNSELEIVSDLKNNKTDFSRSTDTPISYDIVPSSGLTKIGRFHPLKSQYDEKLDLTTILTSEAIGTPIVSSKKFLL